MGFNSPREYFVSMNSIKNNRYIEFISYFVLISVLAICSFFYVFFKPYTSYQLLVVSIMSGFYFLWGIIHAQIEGRLNLRVVTEYILISLIVFVLAYFALHKY